MVNTNLAAKCVHTAILFAILRLLVTEITKTDAGVL